MIFSNCGIANINEDPTQLKFLLYQDALLLEAAISCNLLPKTVHTIFTKH